MLGLLRGYEDLVGLSDRSRGLREKQIASLRRAVQRPGRTAESFFSLARLLHQKGQLDPASEAYKDEADVLKQGARRFPTIPGSSRC